MAQKKKNYELIIDTIRKHFVGKRFRPVDVADLTPGVPRSQVGIYLAQAINGHAPSQNFLDAGFANVTRVDHGVYTYEEPTTVDQPVDQPVVTPDTSQSTFAQVFDDVSTSTVILFDEISGVLRPSAGESADTVSAREEAARSMLHLAARKILDVARP